MGHPARRRSVCALGRAGLPRPLMACLIVAVLGQYLLGVTTLLLVVPVSVATLHQCGAVILLTVMLVLVHRLSNAPRPWIERQPVLETTVT